MAVVDRLDAYRRQLRWRALPVLEELSGALLGGRR